MDIGPEDILDADMLWVRTLTQVNEQLLANSQIRFVGTATAGFDHLDVAWFERKGIKWANAPGANAATVAEYVLCCLAALQQEGLCNVPARAAVIGVGQVGSCVADFLQQLGWEVILNDPPRQQLQIDFNSVPLDQVSDVDLICVHAALTYDGQFPSYHLLSDDFLKRQKPGCVLINAGRGGLIATEVLLQQTHLHLCLDVWENEPDINLRLLKQARIATPHIAGYGIEAKYRASMMLYKQAQTFFGWPEKKLEEVEWQQGIGKKINNWQELALAVYDPLAHTAHMRQQLLKNSNQVPEEFLKLRSEYLWRKSWASYISMASPT